MTLDQRYENTYRHVQESLLRLEDRMATSPETAGPRITRVDDRYFVDPKGTPWKDGTPPTYLSGLPIDVAVSLATAIIANRDA